MPLLKENNFLEEIAPSQVKQLFGPKLLCRVKKTTPFSGRFYIPAEYRAKSTWAIVEAIGDEFTGNVQKGDLIMFNRWRGREWQSPEEDLMLIEEDDVLLVACRDHS